MEIRMQKVGADGAPWFWDRLDWLVQRVGWRASQVTRTLDWCHGMHHISLALEQLIQDSRRPQARVQETAEVVASGKLAQGHRGVGKIGGCTGLAPGACGLDADSVFGKTWGSRPFGLRTFSPPRLAVRKRG